MDGVSGGTAWNDCQSLVREVPGRRNQQGKEKGQAGNAAVLQAVPQDSCQE